MEKRYIGDGVYVALSRYNEIILTTENGIETTNRIVLEPHIVQSLIEYFAEACKEKS